jgi:hypothetical protein
MQNEETDNRMGTLHAPGDDGTLCGIPAAALAPGDRIIEDDDDAEEEQEADCERCQMIEGEEWRETMREVFGSPEGMSREEFDVMGDIWDDGEGAR